MSEFLYKISRRVGASSDCLLSDLHVFLVQAKHLNASDHDQDSLSKIGVKNE